MYTPHYTACHLRGTQTLFLAGVALNQQQAYVSDKLMSSENSAVFGLKGICLLNTPQQWQ